LHYITIWEKQKVGEGREEKDERGAERTKGRKEAREEKKILISQLTPSLHCLKIYFVAYWLNFLEVAPIAVNVTIDV